MANLKKKFLIKNIKKTIIKKYINFYNSFKINHNFKFNFIEKIINSKKIIKL
jgi:hypothetical protein